VAFATSRKRATVCASPATRAHEKRQQLERRVARGAYDETELVFATIHGEPMYPPRLREAFARLLERAELPKIRFHDLRHTAATVLLESGIPAKVVAEILGHSSTRITLDVYSHVTPGMQEQAVAAMDRASRG
jgi:integrase